MVPPRELVLRTLRIGSGGTGSLDYPNYWLNEISHISYMTSKTACYCCCLNTHA